MKRRPPRSTLDRSSAASDVYKRQLLLFPHDDDPAAVGISEIPPVELTPEGTFYFAAVTPGRYTLEAFAKEGTSSLSASVTVVVADHDVTDAVSYTHLRAHETVLDLVCRLLLETKKIPQH